ncbi:CD3324 family protein [Paenibacillus sp. VCA1]|uniref:CD3324 family protein n=1 Tax=Paenibacillus sp. VCA1 TaxID=3039148 RepID=UPI002870DCEB|nr:CD3324 family protein [Paenibacillus sp. VCA1]MDR9855102.1 CD3324 family protein [Paenibacillus sp. VCA1]
MKYENAGEVIPEKLLKEIQKYAAGKLLYIPIGKEKKGWGETTGYRDRLQKRNRMIRNKYAGGMTVSELADEYFLSLDSIKKIIYSKKNDGHMTYAPTVRSAVEYTNIGMLEEWIQCFLQLTLKTDPVLYDFMEEKNVYFGVVKFPLRLVQLDGIEVWGNAIGADEPDETGDHAADLPPLLIQYEEGKFYCIEQKDMLAALKRRKVNAYPTVIVLKETADYKRFMKHYGNVLFFIDRT